jgi:hypothetical protein
MLRRCALRLRDVGVAADLPGEEVVDLAVPRYRRRPARRGVAVRLNHERHSLAQVLPRLLEGLTLRVRAWALRGRPNGARASPLGDTTL